MLGGVTDVTSPSPLAIPPEQRTQVLTPEIRHMVVENTQLSSATKQSALELGITLQTGFLEYIAACSATGYVGDTSKLTIRNQDRKGTESHKVALFMLAVDTLSTSMAPALSEVALKAIARDVDGFSREYGHYFIDGFTRRATLLTAWRLDEREVQECKRTSKEMESELRAKKVEAASELLQTTHSRLVDAVKSQSYQVHIDGLPPATLSAFKEGLDPSTWPEIILPGLEAEAKEPSGALGKPIKTRLAHLNRLDLRVPSRNPAVKDNDQNETEVRLEFRNV